MTESVICGAPSTLTKCLKTSISQLLFKFHELLARAFCIDAVTKFFFLRIRSSISEFDFRDTVNPMCPTSDAIKDTEHFLLLCPSFDVEGQDLLAGIVELLRPVVQIDNLSDDALTQLLLCNDHELSNDLNRSIYTRTDITFYPRNWSV